MVELPPPDPPAADPPAAEPLPVNVSFRRRSESAGAVGTSVALGAVLCVALLPELPTVPPPEEVNADGEELLLALPPAEPPAAKPLPVNVSFRRRSESAGAVGASVALGAALCAALRTKLPTVPATVWKSVLMPNDPLNGCVFWASDALLAELVLLGSGGAFTTGGGGTLEALCAGAGVNVKAVALPVAWLKL